MEDEQSSASQSISMCFHVHRLFYRFTFNFDLDLHDRDERKPFVLINGIRWVLDWNVENLQFALNYQAQADDLFIVTYPRSGTVWMQNIVFNLQSGGQPFDANRDEFFKQNPHLEIDGEFAIEQLRRPGAIKTHLPMNRVPYNSLAKYICLIRNPKDVCVSYYVFYNMWPEVPKLRFDEFFEYFIEGRLPFNDYFEVLRSAWQWRTHNNVLLIAYEDMRSHFSAAIHKVDYH
jgi:hypothetical protein